MDSRRERLHPKHLSKPGIAEAADEEEVKVVETEGQDHPRELPPMFCRTVVTRSSTTQPSQEGPAMQRAEEEQCVRNSV